MEEYGVSPLWSIDDPELVESIRQRCLAGDGLRRRVLLALFWVVGTGLTSVCIDLGGWTVWWQKLAAFAAFNCAFGVVVKVSRDRAIRRLAPGVLASLGRCPRCGYKLDDDSSSACPECGYNRAPPTEGDGAGGGACSERPAGGSA